MLVMSATRLTREREREAKLKGEEEGEVMLAFMLQLFSLYFGGLSFIPLA